jgi:hypothetical protein
MAVIQNVQYDICILSNKECSRSIRTVHSMIETADH